jgi:hypothetical protein
VAGIRLGLAHPPAQRLGEVTVLPGRPVPYRKSSRNQPESVSCELRTDTRTLTEARVVINSWLVEYNTFRPHRGLGMKTPAGFAADTVAQLKEAK